MLGEDVPLGRVLADVVKDIIVGGQRLGNLVFPPLQHEHPGLEDGTLGHGVKREVDPVQDDNGLVLERHNP